MTITPGHFALSAAQRQFKITLKQYPQLESYWDFDNQDCDIVRLKSALGAMSHGEAIMARFFAGIWLGENTLDFDLIEATKTLDDVQLQVIIDWLSNPAFP